MTGTDSLWEEETGLKAMELQVRSKVMELSGQDPQISSAVTIKDEIEALKEELQSFSFSFFDLSACSPKSSKTKKACAEAVRSVLDDDVLYSKMMSLKLLPIAEIEKKTKLPRKIMERHRKYIITAAIILGGDYPLLSEYMENIRSAKRGRAHQSVLLMGMLMMFAVENPIMRQ